jgi:hypothetical protein
MTRLMTARAKLKNRLRSAGRKGIATVEMAIIFPLMMIMAFAIVDFGRLIQARIIVANVAREGGSLASRDIQSAWSLIGMLQTGSSPLNMSADGKIYIWKIRAGVSAGSPDPYIDVAASASSGGLSVASTIGAGQTNLGLTPQLYNHLEFDSSAGKQTSDISDVTVVEVFYKYTPLTPIGMFVPGLFMDNGGEVILSKAVF